MIGLLTLWGCIPNGTIKGEYACTPEELDDGWEISTPEAEGLGADAVEGLCRELFSEDRYPNVLTLAVIANGAIVAEAAFRDPEDRDRVHHVQSISKTVTSLVAGAALDEGVLDGLDAPIDTWLGDAFPEDGGARREMTVEHLLTMTGGIDVSNVRFGIQVLMKGKQDSVEWLLAQPLYADPGEEMYYRDADPHLLGAAIERAAGIPFDDYAQDVLFSPLGMEGAFYESSPDGLAIAAAGVRIRPRDLAKLGVLALDGGQWDGEQVISRAWIEASVQTLEEPPEEPLEPFGYGYYWWTMPDIGAFTAAGHGGQYVTVFPDDDVVVVLTATPYASTSVGIPLWDWQALVATVVQ